MLPMPTDRRTEPTDAGNDVPALQFDGATKRFASRSGELYTAVENITFDLPQRRFLAVVGPSGCGKSTLLNMAAGLMTPSSGSISVYGRPLRGINQRAGYMFQQDALLPWKTVHDNVMLGLIFRGCARNEASEQAMLWLGKVGLQDFARSYPHELSGGMRKRAVMAQNWVVNPDILFMDEPFSALDIHTRQRMEGELLELWTNSPKSVLFVTHDLEEAIALSDLVIVLSAGPASRVVQQYPVNLPRPRDLIDLRTQPAFQAVYRHIWADLREEVLRSHLRSETS